MQTANVRQKLFFVLLLLVVMLLASVAISFGLINLWDRRLDLSVVNVLRAILLFILLIALIKDGWRDMLTPLKVLIGCYFLFFFFGASYEFAYEYLGSDSFLAKSYLLLIIGFVAFWVGYYLPVLDGWGKKMPRFASMIDRKRLSISVVATFALAAMLFLIYFKLAGGLGNYLNDLNLTRFTSARGLHYILWGVMLPMITTNLWYSYTASREVGRSVASSLQMLLMVLVSLAFVIPLGARIFPIYLAFSLLVSRNYIVKKIRPLTLGLAIVLIVFLAVAYQAFRFYTSNYIRLDDIPIILLDINQLLKYAASEFAVLGDLTFVVRTWSTREGFLFWRSYLWLFILPIPRAFWPGKPDGMSVAYLVNVAFRGKVLAGEVGGIGATVIGEGYANFGVIGVILDMLLLGLVSRMLYRYVSSNNKNPMIVLIYGAFLYSLFLGVQAEISLAIPYFLQYTLPLIIIYRFTSASGPQPKSGKEFARNLLKNASIPKTNSVRDLS